MTLSTGALLFASALLGGGLNSIAGGGSFFTFPALILAGVPALPANATSTFALVPGSLASAVAYRPDLRSARTQALLAASLLGGLLGALLLLRTPQPTFARLVPYLLLGATGLFAAGAPLSARLRRGAGERAPLPLPAAAALQLLIALYGGFFGGGMGILMLALLSLVSSGDLHRMNGEKTLLATCINGVAMIAFVAAGAVRWPEALLMTFAAILGGYGGARLARRIPVPQLRRLVIAVGLALSTYFFLR